MNKHFCFLYSNSGSRGQSLVSVLISVAIMGIVVLGMATMLNYQNRETRALTEKLAASDLQKTLIAALADGSVCQFVLNSPSPLTFNTTAVSPTTPQTINVTSPLYASVTPGTPPTPGPVIAKIGAPASGYSGSVMVKSIQLQITAGSGNSFTGNWLIGFDDSKTVRPLRPVTVSTTITANTAAPNSTTSAAIAACQGGGVGGPPKLYYQILTSGTTWTSPSGITRDTVFKMSVIGAGGGGAGSGQAPGGGGGAGCVVIWYVSGLTPSTAYNIAVGRAGVAGRSACIPVCVGTNGGNGENTVITIDGVTTVAGGGLGGSPEGGPNGAGGTCSNGSIQIPGSGGAKTVSSIGSSTIFGAGGNYGQNGTGYGAGGGGDPSIMGGVGAGSPGAIIIESFL